MAKLFNSGKWFGNCVSRQLDAASMTGTAQGVFTITGGPIRVVSLGIMVTTVIPAGANTVKFIFTPTDGSAGDLSAALDTASLSQYQLVYATGTIGDALVAAAVVGSLTAADTGVDADQAGTLYWLSPGTIALTWSGGPPATGAVQVFMEYRPMSNDSKVALY